MKKSLLFFALTVASYGAIHAQTTTSSVTGVVKQSTGQTTTGATIKITHQSSGATFSGSADANGHFNIANLQDGGPYKIEVTYLGQKPLIYDNVFLKAGEALQLNPVFSESSSTNLDEVVVVGRGLIDIAEDRKTPIAVSTITREVIEEKVGTQDITASMVNTPGVYVSGQAKGFGESSMTTRGFDQSNTAFLLNGQPINGMDNGRVYWSNWSGLTDIASLVQIQRGLGSSKLAISSVGGTVNFVTKSTDMKEGGFVKTSIGNDMFVKSTIAYNTGLMKSGFAVSAMLTGWKGNGYMDKTEGAGQNYFLSVGYKVNEHHNLNLMVTGAPQWHNQGYTSKLSNFLQYGKRYNDNIKTINGIEMNPRKNYYHKPVANLNWDWTINDKSSLSTVVYASMARGGGQSQRNDSKINPNYYLAADVNNHQWFGIVSNYQRKLSDNLNLNAGFDLRDFKGENYRQVTDLLGATSVTHSGNVNIGTVTTLHTYSTNPWKSWRDKPAAAEDRLAWDYDQIIRYAGLFGQLEYAKDGFTAFVQGSVSEQHNSRKDYFLYTYGTGDSESVNNLGYNAKGGVSYTLGHHTLFGNAGVYSRQPYQTNIFMNYKNDINQNAVNEDILGLEAGYKFSSRYFDLSVNAYRTTWENRVTGSSKNASAADVKKYNPTNDPTILSEGQYIYLSNYGVKQVHRGLELDFAARPLKGLTVKGFASIGDWKYEGNATTIVRNENRVELAVENRDLTGVYVGDAAQTTFGLGATYFIVKGLSIDADYRRFERLYGALPTNSNETLRLPNYDLTDAGVSYKLHVSPKNALSFRVNVNNLFNTFYISEATSNNTTTSTTTYWKGIDTSNYVLVGWGRTWNASVKLTF
ncbi:TonB-dependent receptor [Sphingobacterium sp. SRCM116780]|uniref:TonB-dependent receptor n=1 Tax=Sphingobacterium sp. SRCM116780 TaxID=2907623 RepID=UPI001F3A5F2B|nr:TonB-dependent receptor [Sphingobacterium sp. SRCM116780]UIR57764.1 TonB-dependent receptor [Sphingobacterium sp. SRCM116780]